MHFRKGSGKDAEKLAAVFYRSIRTGDSAYTEAQRKAWVQEQPTAASFAKRISDLFVVVVEDKRQVVGFMAMRSVDGYIDLAFIVPEARGQGAFRHMYEMIEHQARLDGLTRLWTHASLLAERAFQGMGFSVIQRETVALNGQKLPRAEMEKNLI